mmetsp:Transcript_60646/g.198423  ORF Transcript_60646/g.198423 Transcript_60646/m.198423 type:complete len:623 (-) Transcript_60646:62-1930(-)
MTSSSSSSSSASAASECLRAAGGSFSLWPCSQTTSNWQWDPTTLQLKTQGKCLTSSNGTLALETCTTLGGGMGAGQFTEQNGNGAPASQTWVLMPTARPQVDLLDTIKLPLRTEGRYVGDSNGARIKLVGVNWLTALPQEASASGGPSSAKAPPAPGTVAKLIRFMGFNSVRIPFSSATELAALDTLVEAATAEKLLVVMCRQSNALEFAGNATRKKWLESLTFMARRYKSNERVVAVDLLSGPGYEEETDTLPLWGVPEAEEQAAKGLGVTLADWRTAAAEGSVAVWAGNPNALVVVQGGMYGTDLMHVQDRPMGFAQDCLFSRVVYGAQERRWFAGLYELYSKMSSMWNPVAMYDELEQAVTEALSATKTEATGSGTLPTPAKQSYEEYTATRSTAAYYLDSDNKAPLWVSELGTATKADNDWWSNTLRFLKESDASWFYAPLGSRKETADGLFDAASSGQTAVVGWKLQDLISVQQLSALHPTKLLAPTECTFEQASNEEAASKRLSLEKFLATAPLNPGMLIAAGSLLALVCCLLLTCCCCCCRRGSRKPSWMQPFSPRQLAPVEPVEERPTNKNFWSFCSCQRQLPIQVPDRMAKMLPASMTSDSGRTSYSQLKGLQ